LGHSRAAASGCVVGFIELDFVALADVAFRGLGEIAAEQVQGEGVTVDLSAGLLQLGIVGGDGSGPGAPDAELMQQAGAVGFAGVAQLVADDGAGGTICGPLRFVVVRGPHASRSAVSSARAARAATKAIVPEPTRRGNTSLNSN